MRIAFAPVKTDGALVVREHVEFEPPDDVVNLATISQLGYADPQPATDGQIEARYGEARG